MEIIWRIFRAWLITNTVIIILGLSISTCILMGQMVTYVIVGFVGTMGNVLQIPLTIMFAIAFGYIAISLILGGEGYFDENSGPNVHRGARLGSADRLRGNPLPTDRNSPSNPIVDAANQFDIDGLEHLGQLLLAILTPSNWFHLIRRLWSRKEDQSTRSRKKKK